VPFLFSDPPTSIRAADASRSPIVRHDEKAKANECLGFLDAK
jgi:hypothetical protein